MSLSDCPKCWDTPCTCGHEWHLPNYQAILRSRDTRGPGTPSHRLDSLLKELAKRFPEAEQPFSSRAPEPRYLEAIDRLWEAILCLYSHCNKTERENFLKEFADIQRRKGEDNHADVIRTSR